MNFVVDEEGRAPQTEGNSLYKGGKQPKDWPGWGAEGAKGEEDTVRRVRGELRAEG